MYADLDPDRFDNSGVELAASVDPAVEAAVWMVASEDILTKGAC